MDKAAEVLSALKERGWTVATAESCTGGLVAGALTAVPGSSAVVDRGYVTYSNAAKREMLGVTPDLLDTWGAVSEPVAQAMAEGARRDAGVDIAVSVTGIAGPGGSDHKPEGMVCFGLSMASGKPHIETMQFGPIGRDAVRAATVEHALDLVLRACLHDLLLN